VSEFLLFEKAQVKPMFPNIRAPKLKTQISEILLNLVIEGKLKDGDMLPPERVLCEELGVSRTVLREAIKSLETRGVLTVIHGKGVRVNPAVSGEIANAFMLYLRRQAKEMPVSDLFDVRLIIEPEIASAAARKVTDEEIKNLENIIARMKEKSNDLNELNKIDCELHLDIAKITKNVFFITIIEELIIPIRQSLDMMGTVDTDRMYKEHRRVIEYIRERDPINAANAMKKSLEYSRELFPKHLRL
jgi:GntR family transcriptional repressor for pyruvate dehydrogenase complex